jgi:hypothetical protein
MISARPGQATGSRSAVPSTSSAVSTTESPVISSAKSSAIGPSLSFGPGTSWRTAVGRPACTAASRTMPTVSPCCSTVPWAKLRRTTSRPASIIARIVSTLREAGPIVPMIFVADTGRR